MSDLQYALFIPWTGVSVVAMVGCCCRWCSLTGANSVPVDIYFVIDWGCTGILELLSTKIGVHEFSLLDLCPGVPDFGDGVSISSPSCPLVLGQVCCC